MRIIIGLLLIASLIFAGQATSFIGQTVVGVQKVGHFTMFNGVAYLTKNNTSIINEKLPTNWELKQNYPNPFNPTTQISYSLPQNGLVKIKIYSTNGAEVTALVNNEKQIGNYVVAFDGSKLASGLYYYALEIDGAAKFVRKMILIK